MPIGYVGDVVGGVKIPSTVSLFLNYAVETNCVEAVKAIRATQENLTSAYESDTISYKEVRRREYLLAAAEEAIDIFRNARQARAILEDYWSEVKS